MDAVEDTANVESPDFLSAYWIWQKNTPAVALAVVPQTLMPVHLNLWLFRGQPPTNGQPVAIKLKKFSYLPLSH